MDAFSNGKTEEISKQLINLKDEITDLSTFFKESFQRINSGIEDVRLNITENTLIIGKESTQPLVELKSLTTDMVSSVRDCDINFLHKEIDVRLFSRQIDDLKMNSETQEVINLLGSLKDLTVKLIEQQTNQRSSSSSNESCTSSVSVASSDPSISEFSLFDNSNPNAATSSPLSSFRSHEKQQE